jgi:hypothetical protein
VFLKNKKTICFILFFSICSYYAYSLFEFEFGGKFIFSIEKDCEAVIHLMLKHNNNIKDEYTMQGAPNAMVKNFDFFEWNRTMYILIIFDHGSLGTMTEIEMVDILIFKINNDKIDLVKKINLKNIVYDGKTKNFYFYRNLSYFHDKKKNVIILFDDIEGKIVSVETHSIP